MTDNAFFGGNHDSSESGGEYELFALVLYREPLIEAISKDMPRMPIRGM